MEMTAVEIKEAIASGKISAITLDTSIFDGNGNRFEHGLLARLKQFNDTKIHVVVSDVVMGEVKSHVARDAADAQSKIRTGLKEVGRAWQVSQKSRENAINILFDGKSASELAEERFSTFVEAVCLDVIPSNGRVDLSKVLNAYFASLPPFGKSAAKKSEFPDAFALHALENWAEAEKTILLVVTKDGDWQTYCKSSAWLVSSDDLAKALSYFHQNADVACARLVERFEAENLDINESIASAIRDAVDRIVFDPQISSGYFYEANVSDVEIDSIMIAVDGETQKPFKVIDKPEENVLVVEANVEASVLVTSTFDFSVTDPIDKDEVSIGSASATAEKMMEVKVLLTFEGDLSADAELVDIEVEINAKRVAVDYGDIGPYWGSSGDEEDS